MTGHLPIPSFLQRKENYAIPELPRVEHATTLARAVVHAVASNLGGEHKDSLRRRQDEAKRLIRAGEFSGAVLLGPDGHEVVTFDATPYSYELRAYRRQGDRSDILARWFRDPQLMLNSILLGRLESGVNRDGRAYGDLGRNTRIAGPKFGTIVNGLAAGTHPFTAIERAPESIR